MAADRANLLLKSLRTSRIFGDLGDDLINDIMQFVQLEVVHGGDVIFAQGQPSDSMILVVSGRLLATFTEDDGTQRPLAEISPGSSAGELGLILQQPRSASVIAVRDSYVGILTHDCFQQLLARHPVEINRAITRTVFEYNTLLNKKSRLISATIITFIATENSLQAEEQCHNLCNDVCASIRQFASVKHFTPEVGKAALLQDADLQHAGVLIHELEQKYDYLVFEVNNDNSAWSTLATRQSDQIIAVSSISLEQQSLCLADELCAGSMFHQLRKSLVLLHPPQTEQPVKSDNWPVLSDFNVVHPIREKNTSDAARLARHLTDRTVALVLGGGGARGMAHVGVLQALHEANIPVDYVCGNSMGALIGAQYVLGTPIEQLVGNTQEFIKGGERLAIPFFSLLAGSRIRRDLQRMFGETAIECLWQPFFAISCNLSKAEINVHEQGAMWQAVLASNSPAGIMPPVVDDGNLLVDAALLDNVPVEAMRQRLRYGTLIAVDVDVSDEMAVSPKLRRLSKFSHFKQWFTKSSDNLEKQPGILELLNRAGHLGGLARRKQAKTMADYYLQPPVAEFSLMAYNRGEDIAAAAYEYTKTQITDWPEYQFYQSLDKPSV